MVSPGATQLATVVLIFLVVVLDSNLIAGQTLASDSSDPGTELLGTNNVSEAIRQSDDTVRVDPLKSFKKYRGGFNITNKHYWSSTIFTGIYGYAIAVVWLLCGIAYGGFLLVTILCCESRRNGKKKQKSHCTKQCYLWHILLAILFSILAITASGLVLGGNGRFHSRAKAVVDIIIDTADDATDTIYKTTGAMKDMRDYIGRSDFQISGQTSDFLKSTSESLNEEADEIQRQARKNRRLIDKGLKIVYIVTTVTISFTLVAALALSASGILRLRRALNFLIALCWILTVLCWLFFGLYLFIENFSKDTCTALESFQENPYNNSLSSILPCKQLHSAKLALSDVGKGVYNLVNQVNENLTALQSPVYLCNPFSSPPNYEYQAGNCSGNTIQIGDIPEFLKAYVSTRDYEEVVAYTSSIQDLLNMYPEMENLVECQIVKDAFAEILSKHCKPLKRYVRMEWASLLLLSLVMVVLVLTWTVQTRHEQQHHSLDNSVKPHSASANEEESATATTAAADDQ